MSERERCDRFYREGGPEEGACPEEHLSTCRDCAEDRRKHRWVIDLLGKMEPEDPKAPLTPLPGWEERLLARLDREFPAEESDNGINVGLQDWTDLPEEDRISDLGMEEVQEQAEAALCARGWTWLCERLSASRQSEALVRTLVGHTSSVWGTAVMPDGRSALSASHDGTLRLWEISSGCELRTLKGHASQVNGVAVTPDGRLAVSASDDGTLKVWELASGRERFTLRGHAAGVTAVAVTPDGHLAISASEDKTLMAWDLATGRVTYTLTGHTSIVTGVAVTPNGRLAVSRSEDTTLRVWDLAEGRSIATLEANASFLSCAVAPDGRTIRASAGSLHALDWIFPSEEGRGPLEARIAAMRDPKQKRPQLGAFTPGPATRHAPEAACIGGASGSGVLPGTAGGGAEAPEPAGPPPAASRIKILFLAFNPTMTTQLHLTREARRIEERLGTGKCRDSFELVPRWAVRRSDLQRLLLEEKPHVLHFSSHGSTRAQFFLEEEERNAAPVAKRALVDLIGVLKNRLQLVVLNACDTEPFARALVQHVACAIGMRQPIGDDAAIAFAVSFYEAIAFAEPVATAFRLACNALKLQQIPEEQTPTLRVKRGVNATKLVLTGQ